MASIILKGKKFGTTTRALAREVEENPKTTVAEPQSRDAVGRWEKVPQSQLSLQPSTSRAFITAWPDGSPFESPHRVCQNHSKDSQTMRNEILWADETKIDLFGVCGENPALLIIYLIQSQQWNMVVAASCYAGVLQLQDDWLPLKERWMRPSTEMCWKKTSSRVLRTSGWAEGSLSNKMTKAWLWNNSVTFLDWPSQSTDLNSSEDLWRDLERDVHQRSPSKLMELERICVEGWQKIPKSRCENTCCIIPKKIHGCTSSKSCFYSMLSKGSEHLGPCDISRKPESPVIPRKDLFIYF